MHDWDQGRVYKLWRVFAPSPTDSYSMRRHKYEHAATRSDEREVDPSLSNNERADPDKIESQSMSYIHRKYGSGVSSCEDLISQAQLLCHGQWPLCPECPSKLAYCSDKTLGRWQMLEIMTSAMHSLHHGAHYEPRFTKPIEGAKLEKLTPEQEKKLRFDRIPRVLHQVSQWVYSRLMKDFIVRVDLEREAIPVVVQVKKLPINESWYESYVTFGFRS